MSPSPRRRKNDSSELDVFDASRYFSGCIDGVGFGFGYNSTAMVSHRPINAMKKSLEMMASIPCQKVESTNKEEKKYKQQPISPGRKFATFFNSLFQQTPSKKRQNQKPVEQVIDQSNEERKIHSENKGNKFSKSLKSFNGAAVGEKKWLLRRNGDEFLLRKREEDGMREKKKKKKRRDEENGDDESDSSSDLFELKSYDFGDFSCRLPVYQTANAGFIRRGTSVSASFAF
ncbi:uncharacterized protein LOC110019530 [Phalaenopsis equestris]|uniref:uncharacterized protein LOC110019530 n=1 Tax=Phalaenopsis equestris TaxID=78828 RepID=UPI0009E598AA|nr:uncharacterized protein LOC110019530 [Phalaenopsis equestris]